MSITLDQIKELRKRTGAGVTVVKEALEESNGDIQVAIEYLRKKGIAKAAKRADKHAENGFIASYVHGEGAIAVLVELNSETDFTARNDLFRSVARDIAIHIAASNPEYLSVEDVPSEVLEKEMKIAKEGIDGNKPEEIVNKIVDGRLQKFYEQTVLLEQQYVKDDSKKIKDLISETVSAIGEKIEIGRFARFQLAGPVSSCGIN